jgi:predicted nucleotidyltransferase component of viral defense system
VIAVDHIAAFYPEPMRGNAGFRKHILKEYVQLLVLDHLAATRYVRKIAFIGGTCLRLVKGIDRFSEDLDFDCKGLSKEEFFAMSEDVIAFLRRHGLKVETRDKETRRLAAFRRGLHFPELPFELGLSGHREERFLLKLEAQDQEIGYTPTTAFVKGCGLFFPFPVPPDGVMCAMKIAAMLARGKGRDFYDVMFLLAQTQPDYGLLAARCGICNLQELKAAAETCVRSVDLRQKQRDFEHLLFHRENSRRILRVGEFIQSL